jgi:cell division protein FtsL
MSSIRTLRAVALPAVVLRPPDLRRWGSRAAVVVWCLAAALFLTALRLEITRLHYDLSRLYEVSQQTAGEVAQLEVEAAAIASPKRIEERALRLGFVYPRPDQVVVLDE